MLRLFTGRLVSCSPRQTAQRWLSSTAAIAVRSTTRSAATRRPKRHRRPAPSNKIFFQSLGCPRNFVDTEVMLGIVLQAGFELTQQVDQADFLVINTCGFLKAARQESKSEIALLLNEKKPTSKLIVTGCMVNLHKEEILEDYPQIDHVLGAGSIDKILKVIQKTEATVTTTEEGEHSSSRLSRRSFLEDGEVPRFVATPKHYAYLKISEGCRKRCSFCIIPKIKGPLRSKPSEQIINECRALLKNGSKEIILIAQDLGDYGKDLKGKGNACLATMLRELLSSIHDADFWLRLMYLYPDEITNDIIDIMQSDKRICRYLDMPIQHINDEILKRMRRKTKGSDIRQTILKLRSKLPDVHIRTSLMVGFPGETQEQFQELLDFVQQSKLENVGVFQYSNEEMALSSRLDNHVPEDVKQDRYNRLMEAQLAIVCERNRDRISQTLEQVVIEGIYPENEDWIVGRYFGQCPDIDGQVIIDDFSALKGQPIQPGSRYRVELTDYMHYDLMGRIVV